MNILGRWWRFNLVGAMGMGVQLAVLAALNRAMPGHLLMATAGAVEVTLLHNFACHRRYTWRERGRAGGRRRALWRFHLSNGLVSLVGNMAMMRWLTGSMHLPVLGADAIAIACCSVVNFWLGETWAFAEPSDDSAREKRRHDLAVSAMCVLLALCSGLSLHVGAQVTKPSSANNSDPPSGRFGTDCAYENVFVGPAAAMGDRTRPAFNAGITFGQYFARRLGTGVAPSPQFELGIMGPIHNGHDLDGLASFDLMFADEVPRQHVFPAITVGYTRMFVTGNAVNFGVGVDFGKEEYRRLFRMELRDYYLFTGPRQHVIELRLGLGKLIPD